MKIKLKPMRLCIIASLTLFQVSVVLALYAMRYEIHYKLVRMNRSADIVFVGDSLTLRGGAWDWRLGSPLGLRTINLGYGGAGLEVIRWIGGERAAQLSKNTRLVCVMAGTNDIGKNLERTKELYEDMLDQMRAYSEHIIISSTLPTSAPNSTRWVIQLNDFLRSYAERHGQVIFLDLWPTMTESGTLQRSLTSDGVHLSEEGYRKWSALLRQRIQQLPL